MRFLLNVLAALVFVVTVAHTEKTEGRTFGVLAGLASKNGYGINNGYPPVGYPQYPGYPGHYPGYPGYSGYHHGYPGYPGYHQGYPGYPGYQQGYPGYPGYNHGYPGYNHGYPGYNHGYPGYPGHPEHNHGYPGYYPGYPGQRFPGEAGYAPDAPGGYGYLPPHGFHGPYFGGPYGRSAEKVKK